jgi:hypothetical protein
MRLFICRKRNSPTLHHNINRGKEKRGERVGLTVRNAQNDAFVAGIDLGLYKSCDKSFLFGVIQLTQQLTKDTTTCHWYNYKIG